MTQNLLDTTTILLNSTKSEFNLGNNTKNYSDNLSGGKSFNDILSKVNNNYSKDNKLTPDNSNKNNSNNNSFGDKKLKDLNGTKTGKNEVSSSGSKLNKTTNDNQKSTTENKVDKTKDTTSVENKKASNTETNAVKSDNKSENTNVSTNETELNNTETTFVSEDLNTTVSIVDTPDLLQIDMDEDLTDIQNLNLLLDEDFENDNAQADFYINAYYQSTLDSLNQSEVADLETVDLTNNELLTQVVDEQLEDITEDILPLDIDLKETTTKDTKTSFVENDTVEDLESTSEETTVDNKTDSKADTLKNTSEGKETLSQTNTKTEKQNENEIVDKTKKVEVDTFTNEDNVVDNDVLVKVSDDVMQDVPVIDVTKSDTKLSFREVMEKAGLDEAKLEALNMTVTSSSNSEGNLGGNLGQNSAQDEVAKITLETQGKKDTVNIQNKDFSKVVDSKQKLEEQSKEISKNDILAQINNKMQAQNINGTKRITLQLTPESLGRITVEIMKGKDGLQAKMLTDNFQVKEMLEKNIDGLKTTLANQGVTVNSVTVKVAAASESSSEFSFGRENFNEENTQQQNFAGTNYRQGENESQYEQKTNSKTAMNDENDIEVPTEEELISEGEELILDSETEKFSVGIGNVDIEV